jgi:hypothetical protein
VPVPEHVQVLSIEHSDDLVPSLDGAPNRDRSNWITVTAAAPARVPAGSPPADPAEPLLAHRSELYRSTAERIDRSSDPSIVSWRKGLTPFLAGSGGSGSGAGWDVEISRVGTS